jgi:hypothetical protein
MPLYFYFLKEMQFCFLKCKTVREAPTALLLIYITRGGHITVHEKRKKKEGKRGIKEMQLC